MSVAKGEDGYNTTRQSLEALDFIPKDLQNKRVMIKPNAGRLVDPNLGINTSPQVVAAVIDYFLEADVKDIVVAESPILGVKALDTLEKCGIAEVARKRNIPLIDLDAEKPISVDVPDGKVVKHLKICKEVLNTDFIVSVPVMKTHMHTQVSLSIKNMKGCLYEREKVRLHQLPSTKQIPSDIKPLDAAVVDLVRILIPDMSVIDGTIGLEGMGPSAGDSKQFGVIVSSLNCLAADIIAAELMGKNINEIKHLKYLISEINEFDKEYNFSKDKIQVSPSDYKKWITEFLPPPEKISLEFKNVIVEDKDSCSACLSTVLMFLKRYHEGFADYFSPENPLRISLGKAIGTQQEKTLLIGNCTAKQRKGCIFVKGCPPVASQIYQELKDNFDIK